MTDKLEWFSDCYSIRIKLEEDGCQWVEKLEKCSLADFEVWYGNNVYHIVELDMRLVKVEEKETVSIDRENFDNGGK